MRLLSCCLRNLRLHRELSLRFDPQLTLIGGPNEAGKSTLVEALHKGLFLKANATGPGAEELRSRLHTGLPEVEIGFEASGRSWLLRKRFSGGSGTCQLSEAGGASLRGAEAEERLAQLLGVEGPIDGRRIGQLPERWAHLWVRQGEAGRNPLDGRGERYDLQRLVQQLQQRSSATALLSSLDQQVNGRISSELAGLFTATGRVKAGSPLAQAQDRCRLAAEALAAAEQRFGELENAMEQWHQLGERLQKLEQQERPALQAELRRRSEASAERLKLEAEQRLRQAELEPLLQQVQSLRQQHAQLQALLAQQAAQLQEQVTLQQHRNSSLEQQQQLQERIKQGQEQLELLQRQRLNLQQRQELAQLLLDQQQLEREAGQLTEHQQQFSRLQAEAANVKASLARLAPIGAEQVRQLRSAEQRLERAEARQQALATRLSLLASDQVVRLAGEPLAPGDERLLLEAVELEVGSGVRLQLSPGGGAASGAAGAEQDQASAELERLRASLQVAGSEAAEAIERQRRDGENALANLRQAAAAIPWSRLEQELAAIEPRRQQLSAALLALQPLQQELQAEAPLPLERSGLEQWLQQLRASGQSQQQAIGQAELALQKQRRQLEQLVEQGNQEQRRLEQLAGSLQTLSERRQLLEDSHGSANQQAARLAEQERLLAAAEAVAVASGERLKALAGTGEGGTGPLLEQQLAQLEAEREGLFVRRGQLEQLCASLGAADPSAELERCRAALEAAAAERLELERDAAGWKLLQELFDQMQRQLADRYSVPLNRAIASYLEVLAGNNQGSQLAFDPGKGFGNLQLNQGGQAYRFEELSGGMREQLAAALRLAMAEVLQPAYDGVLPLIFDDAFTNTDPERLQGLQAMLRRGAGQGSQIIVLSCQPQAYLKLTANLGSLVELPGPTAIRA
ncbi:MAG: AAA family ATPase [Prochlorococcaceae cyanobacterium]